MLQKCPLIPVKARKRGYLKSITLRAIFRKHSTGMNRSIGIISGVSESSIQMVNALDLTISGCQLFRLSTISAGYNCSNTELY